MSIRDWFNGTKVRDETETSPPVDDVLLRALLNGDDIDRNQALMVPEVSSCVDLICSMFALLPVKLYKRTTVDGKEHVEEVKGDPRIRMLNEDTGDTLDAYQFKMALCEDYLLGKGGYAYINKTTRNRVKSLNYVQDRYITIMHGTDPVFKTYNIVINGEVYEPFQFIKMLRHTKNGWTGHGIVEEVNSALKTAYQTILYQLQLVEKGGNKKGFITAEHKLSQDEINRLKVAWNRLYSSNQDNVVILNKGLDFKESSNTSVEMQLNQSKVNLNNDIDRIFHMDSNADTFIKRAILPIGTAFKTALNRDLLLEKEKGTYFFDVDYSETLKASMKERFEAYKTGKEAGFIGINEIRQRENLPQIDGLDIIDFGLGSAMFDMNTGKIYVPNTNATVNGEEGENGKDEIEPDAEGDQTADESGAEGADN